MYNAWYTCAECGKRSYSTRRKARYAARQLSPGCNAYQCPDGNGWHIGHLPARVRRGELGREDITITHPNPARRTT